MIAAPDRPCRATFIALGREQALLQGLGGYTRGCADAPPRRKLHTFEDQNPSLALEPSPRSHYCWVRGHTDLNPQPPTLSRAASTQLSPSLPSGSAAQLKPSRQCGGDTPGGNIMVPEATMICIDNSEWPYRRFSVGELRSCTNLLQQHPQACRHAPAGQTKPTVSTRVMPSRDRASEGLMLTPTKARGYCRVP